jgi:hypothetical protein
MKLLDEALLKRFVEVGKQDVQNPIVVAHFFNPCGAGNWYATSYDPQENVIFGWAEILPGGGEWGYTSIDELESYVGPFGIGIERDLYWDEKKASEVFKW